MNLLSAQSCKRIDVYFKFTGQFSNYKQMSYLSFYVNQKGDQMKYDPALAFSRSYRDPKQNKRYTLQEYMSGVNETYVYNQSLLAGMFRNQIMSLQQTKKILRNCVHLSLFSKKDMVNYMFGSKLEYEIKNWVQNFKKGEPDTYNLGFQVKEGKLPDEQRKNYFIVVDQKITNYQQLQQLVLNKNQFLDIPNINKILCLDMQVQNINRFNDDLYRIEGFFKQKNIKIKNLSTDKIPKHFEPHPFNLGYRIHKLLEYIGKNVKGNTLIHQLPEYYQFYTEAEKQQSGITNLLRFEPKQVLVFTQRLMEFNFVQEKSEFGFDQIEKSFTYRFKEDPYFYELKQGLRITRYLSAQNKKKNQKLIKMQESGTLIDGQLQ